MMRIREFVTTLALWGMVAPLPRLAAQPAAPAHGQEGMFPFVMPWDDASPTAVDVSRLNPAPLDASRRIITRGGHFVDATGRRVRFLGTGLTFNANFPDKPDAEKIAARLHKFGFNIVRLHNMDSGPAPRGIFDAKSPDKSRFDAGQLDRLDYLIAQLKKNGVYVDLNLHVSRRLEAADGVPDTGKLPGQGKVLAYYEPHLLEIQRRYAHDLLTHVNPYTGISWADEPAVAVIELNNEDTLVGAAWGDFFRKLPEFYQAPLRTGWNRFLKERYATTARALAAWNEAPGGDLIDNGRFLPDRAPVPPDATPRDANAAPDARDLGPWSLEVAGGARAHFEPQLMATVDAAQVAARKAAEARVLKANQGIVAAADVVPAGRALHLKLTALPDVPWKNQVFQGGIDLQPGATYSLTFWGRAGEVVPVNVSTKLDQAPWSFFGLREDIALTPQWRRYTLGFKADGAVPAHTRLSFVVGYAATDLWLADVALRANDNGENLLKNGAFTAELQNWMRDGAMEAAAQDPASVVVTAPAAAADQTPANPPPGRAVHIVVQQPGGAPWNVMLHHVGLPLVANQRYNLQFWARAGAPRMLGVNTKLNQAPWRFLGLNQTVPLTPAWQHFNINFTADNPDAGRANRLSFVAGYGAGDVWLADVALRPGFVTELPAGQTLEAANLDLPAAGSDPLGADFVAFLMDAEAGYVADMTRYLKQTLGTKALVSCSQANFGGLAGVAREATADFVDSHGYWQHPQFPHRAWDPNDWVIGNTAMVAEASGGTLPRLAMHRVEGKPFTVTEYNHPAPSDYSAETLPLLAAYAAWQDWDGVFLFDYTGDRSGFHNNAIKGFFSTDTHPGKMALAPAAATIFLRGDLAPATAQTVLEIPRAQLPALTARFNSQPNIWDSLGYKGMPNLWEAAGANALDLMSARTAIRLTDGGTMKLTKSASPAAPALSWHTTPAKNALFTVDTPSAKAVVGFPAAPVTLDDFGLTAPAKFLSLTLIAGDAKPLRDSRSLLLTAAGRVENTGMVWNADRTSIGNHWGTAPTLADGITGDVTLHSSAQNATVYALDGTGARIKTVPSTLRDGMLSFHVGPEHQTLWYEIAAG